MLECPGHSNLPRWKEVERLAELQKYDILDTVPEIEFDNIAKIAAQICKTPIAYISFLDEHRQWFKARVGLELAETPRERSVCNHAILQPGLSVISDLSLDPRFKDRVCVEGEPDVSFYAGIPLITKNDLPLGMLCVLDHDARPEGLTEQQGEALSTLAQAVMCQLDLKLTSKTAAESEEFTRRLLASSDDCIKVFDLKGRLRFMSQGGMRAMDVEDFRTIEGRHWTDIWSSIAGEDADAAVDAVKSGGIGRFQGPCATMTGTQK
jgi:GAF domain-containing protein